MSLAFFVNNKWFCFIDSTIIYSLHLRSSFKREINLNWNCNAVYYRSASVLQEIISVYLMLCCTVLHCTVQATFSVLSFFKSPSPEFYSFCFRKISFCIYALQFKLF